MLILGVEHKHVQWKGNKLVLEINIQRHTFAKTPLLVQNLCHFIYMNTIECNNNV